MIIWVCVVLLSILELVFIQSKYKVTNFDDTLALLLAAIIFSSGLFYLYYPRFDSENFCLMNKNDPYCQEAKLGCFTQNSSSVFAENFGFGGFIEIGTGRVLVCFLT